MPDIHGPETPEPSSPAQRLAAQADLAEADQNVRLLIAEDPVYSHVATFATASALANIEWGPKRRFERGPELVARLYDPYERVFSRFPAGEWRDRLTARLPVSDGVNLRSEITFRDAAQTGDEVHRALPPLLDRGLVGDRKGDRSLFLSSSAVFLERRARVYGLRHSRLGVQAVHSSQLGEEDIRVEPYSQAVQVDEFEDLIGKIARVTDIDPDDYSEQDDEAIGTGGGQLGSEEEQHFHDGEFVAVGYGEPYVAVSTRPEDHFEFHAALGVPADRLEMAKRSYQAIVGRMGLQYALTTEPAKPI